MIENLHQFGSAVLKITLVAALNLGGVPVHLATPAQANPKNLWHSFTKEVLEPLHAQALAQPERRAYFESLAKKLEHASPDHIKLYNRLSLLLLHDEPTSEDFLKLYEFLHQCKRPDLACEVIDSIGLRRYHRLQHLDELKDLRFWQVRAFTFGNHFLSDTLSLASLASITKDAHFTKLAALISGDNPPPPPIITESASKQSPLPLKLKKVAPSSFPGLANFTGGLDNICFLNGVLKLFASAALHNEAFARLFAEDFVPAHRTGETDEHYALRLQVSSSLGTIIRHIISGEDPQGDKLEGLLVQLVEHFNALATHENIDLFCRVGKDQCDAEEFARHLLAALDYQESSQLAFIDTTITIRGEESIDHRVRNRFDFIPLPLKGFTSLQQSVDEKWQPLERGSEQPYVSDRKAAQVPAVQRSYLVNRPTMLLVQLERFGFTGTGTNYALTKSQQPLTVDPYITIKRFVVKDQAKELETLRYKRTAAVVHLGSSPARGHYVVYNWSDNDDEEILVRHDDRKVEKIPSHRGEDVINKNAYLVYYRLVD